MNDKSKIAFNLINYILNHASIFIILNKTFNYITNMGCYNQSNLVINITVFLNFKLFVFK